MWACNTGPLSSPRRERTRSSGWTPTGDRLRATMQKRKTPNKEDERKGRLRRPWYYQSGEVRERDELWLVCLARYRRGVNATGVHGIVERERGKVAGAGARPAGPRHYTPFHQQVVGPPVQLRGCHLLRPYRSHMSLTLSESQHCPLEAGQAAI